MKNKLAILGGEKTINHSFDRFNTISDEEINAVVKVMKSGSFQVFWVLGLLNFMGENMLKL